MLLYGVFTELRQKANTFSWQKKYYLELKIKYVYKNSKPFIYENHIF